MPCYMSLVYSKNNTPCLCLNSVALLSTWLVFLPPATTAWLLPSQALTWVRTPVHFPSKCHLRSFLSLDMAPMQWHEALKTKELGMARHQLNTTEPWHPRPYLCGLSASVPKVHVIPLLLILLGHEYKTLGWAAVLGLLARKLSICFSTLLCFLCEHEYQVAVQCPSFIISYCTFQCCLHPQIHVLHSSNYQSQCLLSLVLETQKNWWWI